MTLERPTPVNTVPLEELRGWMMTIDRTVKDKVTRRDTIVHNDYLEVKWRLVWLRREYPTADIRTEIVSYNEDAFEVIVRATISLPEGGGTATGLGVCSKGEWKDYVEKAETTAIGRACAALGYGTQFCQDFDIADGGQGKLADAPVAQKPTQQPQPNPAPRPSHLLDEAQKQGATLVPVVPPSPAPGVYSRPSNVPVVEWARVIEGYSRSDPSRGLLLEAKKFAYDYKSLADANPSVEKLSSLFNLRYLPGKTYLTEKQVLDAIGTYCSTGEPVPLQDIIASKSETRTTEEETPYTQETNGEEE
jgi:hypothetical protein